MDLSTGEAIDEIRQAIIDSSTVPIGTVPVCQALAGVGRVEDLTEDDLLGAIEHQACVAGDSVASCPSPAASGAVR
jgi:phosphomethylpyrimidine synthase